MKQKVDSIKLINSVFNKEKTDRIPVSHVGFSSACASFILGREAFVGGGIQEWREAKAWHEGWHDEFLERSYRDAIELTFATGQDMLRPEYWRAPEPPTRKVDEYTYLYESGNEKDWKVLRVDPASEQGHFMYYLPRESRLEDVRMEVREMERRVATYQPAENDFAAAIRAQKEYGQQLVVKVGGVTIGIPLMDAGIWMEAMLLDPQLVKTYIDCQVEMARRNVAFLSAYGFRYFLGGLDCASEQGPWFSKKMFGELILPGLQEVSRICHKHGGYHLFASDGNLWELADVLFGESDIDGYYEVDRKAGMDLQKLRVGYPDLTLIGNISSWTMSQGKPEDVRKEVASCLETARRLGGIIVGVSNYLQPETPHANIETLFESLNK